MKILNILGGIEGHLLDSPSSDGTTATEIALGLNYMDVYDFLVECPVVELCSLPPVVDKDETLVQHEH